jgi:adenosylcobinamide-phosphate synthase
VSATGAAAVAGALALDGLVGEAPDRVHPVALFGRVVAGADRAWPAPRLVGGVVAAALPLAAAGVVWGVVALAGVAGAAASGAVAALALFAAMSLRALLGAADEVVGLTATDVAGARDSVVALVGRDPSALSAGELRSAAVESAAENLADGLVAPLGAFLLGAQASLAVGAACAAWVKAVNTLDSMLGYRAKPVGWASARLDDLVMWLPARVTAALLAVAAGSPGALLDARRWAGTPASPNSGWPMATLAAVLDVRLAKPGAYDLNPDRTLPGVDDARVGVRLVGLAGLVAAATTGVLAWL